MNRKISVVLVHISIWLALIAFPLLVNSQALANLGPRTNSFIYTPFFFFNIAMIGIFYLNYFFFIPRYLFEKKYIRYFTICVLLFLFIKLLPSIIGFIFDHQPPPRPKNTPLGLERRENPILPILETNSFLMYVAVFTTSITLRMNNRMKDLEKEKYSAQLSFLKSQINPHFLFNTLNSIYSVTLKKSPVAADMISRLSEMMRYNMHDSQKDQISLQRELEILSNYIELQKVRINENVKLNYSIGSSSENLQILPLLLIPFVENAFKYGVSPEHESVIMIDVSIEGSYLTLLVRNTLLDTRHRSDKGGIGIGNTRKRLDLMYPNRHKLSVNSDGDIFSVTLEISLI